MNGIDISSYETDLNTAQIPGDFVIVKATQGKSYVNPDYTRAMNQALGKKLLGAYHYIGGQGAEAEMDHFIDWWRRYAKSAIACLDWESYQNNAWQNEEYLRQCVKIFIEKTGVVPFIYASLSAFPHAICDEFGCPKWIAQYANDKETGYQSTPWNEGKYTCAIRQYTSTGKLTGWSGKLDLNKAYITAQQWQSYFAGGQNAPIIPSEPSYTYDGWVANLQRECNAQGFSNQAVDGIAGPKTLSGCPMVRMGAQGGITKLIQERLNTLGYACGKADGIFGKLTKAAVEAYQSNHDLIPDGIVGPKTWAKLLQL